MYYMYISEVQFTKPLFKMYFAAAGHKNVHYTDGMKI